MASRPKIAWVPKDRADRCTSCGEKGADARFQIGALNFALCPNCVKSVADGTRQLVELHVLQGTVG